MFAPIEDILADLRAGRMIVLTDDEDRENEGDLVLAAQSVTPEAITFMLSVARGYLCLSLTSQDCDRLDLHAQSAVNTTTRGTAFTVSIDGHPRHGFTTGVSARERAKCIQMVIDPRSTAADFVRPGHINPLRSRDGGTLVRTGQTEGSLDLCRLAGLYPAACIIEIMRDDGEMARVPDLQKLCAMHHLKMCSVAQIIQHRLARESLVRRIAPTEGRPLRTRHGTFNLLAYESVVDPVPHLALTVGDIGRVRTTSPGLADSTSPAADAEGDRATLVRMHRRGVLGDVFGDLDSSRDGATSDVLHSAMAAIQSEGRGAIVYLRPEGVGDAFDQRLHAIRRSSFGAGDDSPDLTHPQGLGAASVPMAQRDFGIGGQILRDLGLTRLRLLTNSSTALPGLDAFGIEIVERVPLSVL